MGSEATTCEGLTAGSWRAQVSRGFAYAGLAKNVVQAKWAPSEALRLRASEHLAARLGRMRGLPQKVGQIASFSWNEDKEADRAAFQHLQNAADPLPWAEIQQSLEATWKVPVATVLRDYESRGKAASLGQVHRAVLHDGREVAIKVLYPGIRQAIWSDLNLLGWFAGAGSKRMPEMDLSRYRASLESSLSAELDYRIEADNMTRLRQWLAHACPALPVVVPEVVEQYSTSNVLVTSWEAGETWDQVQQDWEDSEKQQLGRHLLQMFCAGLFRRGGLIQADWHPGNFSFRRHQGETTVVLYDFGSVFQPDSTKRMALTSLISKTIDCAGSPWQEFLSLGFNPELLEPLAEKLPAICQVMFEPFCVTQPFQTSRWRLGERVAEILGEDRWNFRLAGPAELIPLVRAFHGLTYYVGRLDCNLRWQSAFETHANRSYSSPTASRDLENEASSFHNVARHLHLRVERHGVTKVKLTLPASRIEQLDELMDDDLKQRLRERGVSLPNIVRDVRRRAYGPGPVFELIEPSNSVVVWLE
jgi:predicted unusual protein kinase regulating ubiquinone biosynthesis (AarF/ABC1/UbiB family)